MALEKLGSHGGRLNFLLWLNVLVFIHTHLSQSAPQQLRQSNTTVTLSSAISPISLLFFQLNLRFIHTHWQIVTHALFSSVYSQIPHFQLCLFRPRPGKSPRLLSGLNDSPYSRVNFSFIEEVWIKILIMIYQFNSFWYFSTILFCPFSSLSVLHRYCDKHSSDTKKLVYEWERGEIDWS